jgi:hypothetical protein
LARCFELDFAKVHGFDVGDREENDNVTPIRPVPNSVPTKETAPEGAAASA